LGGIKEFKVSNLGTKTRMLHRWKFLVHVINPVDPYQITRINGHKATSAVIPIDYDEADKSYSYLLQPSNMFHHFLIEFTHNNRDYIYPFTQIIYTITTHIHHISNSSNLIIANISI
jgi:hypothetical protein